MLVPNTSSLEHIYCNRKRPESYITAQNPPNNHQSQTSEMCTQPDLESDIELSDLWNLEKKFFPIRETFPASDQVQS